MVKSKELPESSYAHLPGVKQTEEKSEVYLKVPSKKLVDFGDSVLSKDYFNYKRQSLKTDKVIPSRALTDKFSSMQISHHQETNPEKTAPAITKDVRHSGVQAQPNIVYQIFYETLEQNKRLGISASKNKEPKSIGQVKSSTILLNSNKVTQEVIPKKHYEVPMSDKKQPEEVNNSIKDIIFNDGLFDAFDDNMSDDQDNNNEILKNLEDKNPLYYKRDYTEVIEEDMIDINERHEDNNVNELVNWAEYPEYIAPKNQILLKASSLFDNSIIMDNEFIIVYCKTEREFQSNSVTIMITLTYKAKINHLSISTHLLGQSIVKCMPPMIINQPLIDSMNQNFIYDYPLNYEMAELPKLQISLTQYHNHVDFLVPVPFTINKFTLYSSNNPDVIYSFLEGSKEFFNGILTINQSIIENARQIVDVFPDMLKLDENIFINFIQFGYGLELMTQFKVIDSFRLEIVIHTHNEDLKYVNYLQWLYWIFASPGTY